MWGAAIEGVSKLLTRVIDLFDMDPERARQKRIAKAMKRASEIERELDDILLEIEKHTGNR